MPFDFVGGPLTDVDALAAIATRRTRSMFAEACALREHEIAACLRGARVFVVGGAGSIGSATVRLISEHPTAALHVSDLSENYLADLVRELRNRPRGIRARDFRTYTLDYGGTAMAHLLANEPAFDVVLCFAAHKHVRGERDGYSLLSMVDTNLLKLARFKECVATHGHGKRLFSVSTDKAANPSSAMGASKRAMEDVLFGHATRRDMGVATARFANVAFSNGSLLQAFLRGLGRGEPLAVPEATRRYFVSSEEAGHLCLLASLLADDGGIVIPDLDPEAELIELRTVAEGLLDRLGLEARFTHDEAEAGRLARERPAGVYPVLLTRLDTGGEKPYEEFVAAGETARDWLPGLRLIDHVSGGRMAETLAELRRIKSEGGTETAVAGRIVAVLKQAVVHFAHRAMAENLDQRL